MQARLEEYERLAVVERERDAALRDLARLKQHLLEKDAEEQSKLDEESDRISFLEHALADSQAELSRTKEQYSQARQTAADASNEMSKVAEENVKLKQEVVDLKAAMASKDTEVNNLQRALGVYYAQAENEDKLRHDIHRLHGEIATLQTQLGEESARVVDAHAKHEELLSQQRATEMRLEESEAFCRKLQDEIMLLRRALEHSMVRVQRLAWDSDDVVDRRIVIKLLLTYFERHHSQEVLDVMARILGFTDEEKLTIQRSRNRLIPAPAKGVLRGLVAMPQMLVSGLAGGKHASGDQPLSPGTTQESFANAWIEFLLKESEAAAKEAAREAASKTPQPPPPSTTALPTAAEEKNSYQERAHAPDNPTTSTSEGSHSHTDSHPQFAMHVRSDSVASEASTSSHNPLLPPSYAAHSRANSVASDVVMPTQPFGFANHYRSSSVGLEPNGHKHTQPQSLLNPSSSLSDMSTLRMHGALPCSPRHGPT